MDGRETQLGERHTPAVVRFAVRVSQFPNGLGRDSSAGSESKARARLLGTNLREWMNLPTIASLMATETQVHRTQVTKASCPQIHGGAVRPGIVPMRLSPPQEFRRTRPIS